MGLGAATGEGRSLEYACGYAVRHRTSSTARAISIKAHRALELLDRAARMRPAERVDVKGRAREHLLRLLLVGQVPIHTDFSTRCPPRQARARRQQRPDARAEKTGAAASQEPFKIPMFQVTGMS